MDPKKLVAEGYERIAGRDEFHRVRVDDYRIMYEVIDEDRVILVLGMVHRGDLERWLRNR